MGRGIPCITTLTGATAALRAIRAIRVGETSVVSLQELHGGALGRFARKDPEPAVEEAK